MFFLGPSEFLNLMPDEVWVIMVGCVFLGMAAAITFEPVPAEIIQSVEAQTEKEIRDALPADLKEGQKEVRVKIRFERVQGPITDKAYALVNMAFSCGQILGPMSGGHLTDVYGYRTTCEILMVASLVYATIN